MKTTVSIKTTFISTVILAIGASFWLIVSPQQFNWLAYWVGAFIGVIATLLGLLANKLIKWSDVLK